MKLSDEEADANVTLITAIAWSMAYEGQSDEMGAMVAARRKRRSAMNTTVNALDRVLEDQEIEQVTGGMMNIPGNHTVDILAMKYGVTPQPGNPGATLLQLGQLGVFGPFG